MKKNKRWKGMRWKRFVCLSLSCSRSRFEIRRQSWVRGPQTRANKCASASKHTHEMPICKFANKDVSVSLSTVSTSITSRWRCRAIHLHTRYTHCHSYTRAEDERIISTNSMRTAKRLRQQQHRDTITHSDILSCLRKILSARLYLLFNFIKSDLSWTENVV